MKTSQKVITTLTTIADTKTDILSSRSIAPTALKVFHRQNSHRSPQLKVSIVEEARSKKKFTRQSIQNNLHQTNQLNRSQCIEVISHSRTTDLKIASALEKIFFKKKRYCFQVLKQFYLFPDETQSSIQSLSVYDPLVFQEEIIHSLVKIMETRVITNKMWGFINLKIMPFLKAAKKIQQQVTEIQQKTIRRHKKYSFEMIKQAAQEAISAIQKPDTIKQSRCIQINTSYLYSQNKQVQCGIEQKFQKRKSYLTSNIIHEQVRPTMKTTRIQAQPQIKPVCESTTRVYTREQYELKCGKMKDRNQNYEQKVVRISSPEYSERKNFYNEERTNLHTFNTTEYRVPTFRLLEPQPKPQIKVSTLKQQTKVASEIKNLKKYNIIHYHERPREITHSVTLMEKPNQGCGLNTSCISCSPCANRCCCCQQSFCGAQNRASCCLNNNVCRQSRFCEKYQKSEMVNETRVSEHVKFINEPKSTKNIYSSSGHQYELSELESRIQYLNFLKSLAKQQQMQQSLS